MSAKMNVGITSYQAVSPLISILRDAGGRASPRECYDKLQSCFLIETKTYAQQSQVRWGRQLLQQLGYLLENKRGQWVLSKRGWKNDFPTREQIACADKERKQSQNGTAARRRSITVLRRLPQNRARTQGELHR